MYADPRFIGVPEPPVPVAALTDRLVAGVYCEMFPDAPMTFSPEVGPVAAVLVAVRVSVLGVVLVMVVGLNPPVTPLGRPVTEDKVTLPLNPFSGVTAMVLVAVEAWLRYMPLGVAESAKLGTPRVRKAG